MSLSEARDGANSVMPMAIGVVPFGLAFGASTVAHGYGTPAAVGFSVIVFAGAAQFAAVQALAGGASALVAAAAAWTVNLRLLLYSASLAPYFSEERLPTRLFAAYPLTDQAFAAAIARWEMAPGDRTGRFRFYVAGAFTLWVVWQVATITGAVIGTALPNRVPLDFSIPLVFLALLMPTITSRPAAVAAIGGGAAAVVAAELGAQSVSILIGAVVGIAAGALAEGKGTRR